MRIDFNKIESSELRNYKNGVGGILSKIVYDGNKKLMIHKLKKGSSIGIHIHDESTEIIYVLSGVALITEEDDTYLMGQGEMAVFKPKSSHGIKNDNEEDLEILTIVY